jgi:hypothetical protein
MKRTPLPPLDLIEARRCLVALRSSHSDNRQITTVINQLIGRLAHLSEPENKRHEDYLRKIIAVTIGGVERIVSQRKVPDRHLPSGTPNATRADPTKRLQH